MKFKKILLILFIINMSLFSISCSKKETEKIVIAEQFGLAYAPIQIMKEKNFLSDKLENEVEWVKLGNTAAIREAMLSGSLDVGFLGIPPFLIGYENGMDWKIFSGLSSSPLGLVTSNSNIKSLKDIENTDRIVVPQPGSIQHILLSMAALSEFGDAKYFDNQLVTLKHPDGMSALLSGGDITLHFTSPPYLFEELKENSTSLVIDGNQCFGDDFTFIIGVTTKEFNSNKTAYEALNLALEEAILFMNENHDETIEILSKYYDYDVDVLIDYIYNQNIEYNSDVNGLTRFVEFMKDNGYLEKIYSEEELKW